MEEYNPVLDTEGSAETGQGNPPVGANQRGASVNRFENNRLRMKYNPQQIIYNRAVKAQTICQLGNLINREAISELERIKQAEKDIDSHFQKLGGKQHYVQRVKRKDNKVALAM